MGLGTLRTPRDTVDDERARAREKERHAHYTSVRSYSPRRILQATIPQHESNPETRYSRNERSYRNHPSRSLLITYNIHVSLLNAYLPSCDKHYPVRVNYLSVPVWKIIVSKEKRLVSKKNIH